MLEKKVNGVGTGHSEKSVFMRPLRLSTQGN